MQSKIQVIPAIIPKSFFDLEEKLSFLHRVFGDKVQRVQIDILDGVYTEKASWPYNNNFADFEQLESSAKGLPFWEDYDFEFDLMIKNPEKDFEKFIKAGASTLVIHIESMPEDGFQKIISTAKDFNVTIGIALKPSTPNEKISYIMKDIEFVQFMGNDRIGYHGVALDENVYTKIENFKTDFPDVSLGVDIGVNLDTAEKLKDIGVDRLVSGSAIFKSLQPLDDFNSLKSIK